MSYTDLRKPVLRDTIITSGGLGFLVSETLDMLAIEYVTLTKGVDVLDLGSFETGTQLKIEPITRQSNNGAVRTVGHKLTGTLIAIHNNLEIIPTTYDLFLNGRVQMDVYLTNKGLSSGDRPQRWLNFSKSDRDIYGRSDLNFDNRVALTYTTEIVDDYRIRLVITVTGSIQNYKYVHNIY